MMPKFTLFHFPSGANACVKLKQFEEAIKWCEKGLAVSFITDASMENICRVQMTFYFCFDARILFRKYG